MNFTFIVTFIFAYPQPMDFSVKSQWAYANEPPEPTISCCLCIWESSQLPIKARKEVTWGTLEFWGDSIRNGLWSYSFVVVHFATKKWAEIFCFLLSACPWRILHKIFFWNLRLWELHLLQHTAIYPVQNLQDKYYHWASLWRSYQSPTSAWTYQIEAVLICIHSWQMMSENGVVKL